MSKDYIKNPIRNRIILVMAVLLLCICIIVLNADKTYAESLTEGNYTYEVYTDEETNEEYAVITKYNGTESSVIIPGTIGGVSGNDHWQ